MVKVKEDLTGWIMSEHGVLRSRLTVVEQTDDYVKPSGKRESRWLCQCSCGSEPIKVTTTKLKGGHTLSCGCLQQETRVQSGLTTKNLIPNDKKFNKYDLTGEYGIGYTSKGEEFYFDLDDYDKIKNYCWYINNNGYVVSNGISLHVFIMCPKDGEIVDHIKHKKYDNRKSELRIVDATQNSINKGLQSNNTSGVPGVSFHKGSRMWFGYIKLRGKQIRRYANSKDEAIEFRRRLEEEYFGNYSYNNSMNHGKETTCNEQESSI